MGPVALGLKPWVVQTTRVHPEEMWKLMGPSLPLIVATNTLEQPRTNKLQRCWGDLEVIVGGCNLPCLFFKRCARLGHRSLEIKLRLFLNRFLEVNLNLFSSYFFPCWIFNQGSHVSASISLVENTWSVVLRFTLDGQNIRLDGQNPEPSFGMVNGTYLVLPGFCCHDSVSKVC